MQIQRCILLICRPGFVRANIKSAVKSFSERSFIYLIKKMPQKPSIGFCGEILPDYDICLPNT